MAAVTTDKKIAELRDELRRLGLPPRPFEEDMLKVYAEAARQFDEATSKLSQLTFLARGPGNTAIVNPLTTVRNEAATTMQRIGTILGFSADHRIAPAMPTWGEFAIALHD